MHNYRGLQFGLLLLILAAFSGLIGFVIVYHYATYERPLQRFAIVIDAGSTQTRSNLFAVDLDASALAHYQDQALEAADDGDDKPLSLGKLFQVRQLDSCVNGGPLAGIQSPSEARDLVKKCLEKFSRRIKSLDFHESDNSTGKDDERGGMAADDMADELVARQRRLNSVTHLHLGATAGMRALGELNKTRAQEKLGWMDGAIGESNSLLGQDNNLPHINKGWVGIMRGADEAAFGWASVNFVCDTLRAGLVNYEPAIAGDHFDDIKDESVGTLELGGASSQMAYRAPSGETFDHRGDLQTQQLELFNVHYRLATRSDLCFGMSQATARANYVLLRDFYAQNSTTGDFNNGHLELMQPCLQRGARLQLKPAAIKDFLHGPCLVPPDANRSQEDADLRGRLLNKSELVFVGTGDVEQCGRLLSKLIDPQLCRRHFQLCPHEKNQRPPPANMSFVTISGYNYALQVLDLKPSNRMQTTATELDRRVAAKLGGHPIEHGHFLAAIRDFCLVDIREFPARFPTMNKKFHPINCFQLVYINKLLTEFYHFQPATSWRQIKFLIFPPSLEAAKSNEKQQQDIGWTLGLLLNATSRQYSDNGEDNDDIFHHHSSGVLFVMRATISLMFACILLAISLIVIGMLALRHHRRKAYISHPLEEELA